jgi:O-antigen ligase
MRAIPHRSWLPAGVSAPFARWGPWRLLLVYVPAWLTVCAIWIGFTRRRTLQWLMIAIAANGVALAGFGVLQRMLSNGKMFWFWESPNPSFFATFIYKNHGGAYLNLALTVTCALAAWYYLRGLRRLEKSNPAGLLVFFATAIGIAILVSYARGATIMMLAFLTACILGFVGHLLWAPNATRKPVIAVALVLLSAFFVKTGTQALRPHLALTRLAEGVTNQDFSLTMRQSATSASLEMLRDHWRTGAGAGSFQFLFPFYQQRYPELYATNGTRHFWEHAHNDVVQFAIELGAPGIALLLAGAAYLVLVLVRNYFWQNPLASLVTLGLVLLLVYAWWDFPFQCPAVLLLWCSLAVMAPMWARFEELHAKG